MAFLSTAEVETFLPLASRVTPTWPSVGQWHSPVPGLRSGVARRTDWLYDLAMDRFIFPSTTRLLRAPSAESRLQHAPAQLAG